MRALLVPAVGGLACACGLFLWWRLQQQQEPPLTADDVRLIRANWQLLAQKFSRIEDVGELFYKTLVAAHPEIVGREGPFFGITDFASQATKLMSMLETLIQMLDAPDRLVPVLFQLGERHALYGVVPAHYPAAGAALVHVLSVGLGTELSPAHAMAWLKMWDVVEKTMIAGSSTPRGRELYARYQQMVAKRS